MLSVINVVSWLFIQTPPYANPVFGLGPCDTAVWVSS